MVLKLNLNSWKMKNYTIFQDKVMLVFKDHNEILNCYEIEDEEIVFKVKTSKNENIERILEDYLHQENLKK